MKPTIVTFQGRYTIDPDSGMYEPVEPAYPYRGMLVIGLSLAAWAVGGGIAYCAFKAFEAVSG